MKNKLRVYLLDSQKYSPETIAVTFAKTSRSPESFDQIAAELTEQKSAEFNEKWVVGYGHSSVAEHAVLHIAIENVSRLAVETLESNRLASYTEKSTRYQTWESDAYHLPLELAGDPLANDYDVLCQDLFALYSKMIPGVSEVIARQTAKKVDESDNAWNRRVRSLAVDECRYILPAASLANVGMTINARALERAISKMLSSNLEEVRTMGQNIKEYATEIIPTLLKYADRISYLQNVGKELSPIKPAGTPLNADWFRLVGYDAVAEEKILAACLYRFQNIDYAQAIQTIRKMSLESKRDLAHSLFADRNRFTAPLREVEHSSFTFEITLDQGAWYEVKRHRMMTLTTQSFTSDLGFALPRAIQEAGFASEFEKLMDRCRQLFPQLENVSPGIGAYILPNAFNRRFLITCNLRSAIHFINLRSAANAHFSVRRLARRMAEEVKKVMPIFAPVLFCETDEDWRDIEKNYFSIL